ncbi:N-acetylneuraminate synthase [Rathayibacter rathayi]|uniref:N-acetylneuraminate synthase family protein n=1 Tax=Rathayibacter rathayi TaxID=33887 RepID=UPI000CE88955|nr:N-acetylneuraminate synthase family protein [Rathayibacter rathayi]PPG68070.1 N-acetylneuraminate synthase [Rathayibacter rathayi]PPG76063.1 N-acetylneuraminate synthase [Rathayibacter rathayi]PPH21135.1 N-acetylneuraminate synthase [Rathayibacter rathayi]PPI75373.1 N-acetylneuraminate synthase [Rathayibacter rathayi]
MRTLTIGATEISDRAGSYVIAEIGHNHGGDLATAKSLFAAAARAGASAVKLQKRDNRHLFTREMLDKPYSGRNSYGATYGQHREALEFGEGEYRELAAVAADLGIDFFTTAFDEASVDFIVRVGLPAIKIASGDLTNSPLLETAARTGLPMIVSSGGATLSDVVTAVGVLEHVGAQFALLQCTATYPAQADQLNLQVIETYRRLFPSTVIGYSGHDVLNAVPVAAYALGARITERHFTLDKGAPGSDHHFSQTPAEMKSMVEDLATIRAALGSPVKRQIPEEAPALAKMAKTLVVRGNHPAGTVLEHAILSAKTSGLSGIRPAHLADVVGRRLACDVDDEHVLMPSDLIHATL